MEVRLPDIGDYKDVPVVEFLVKPGDVVAIEDPLMTVESDKATMEIPAPFAGIIREFAVSIGARVSQGALLLTIDVAAPVAVPTLAISPEAADAEATLASPPAKTELPVAAKSTPTALPVSNLPAVKSET